VKTDYDVIVIGLGGIGSGALYWLARRLGSNALGIEQFELGHVNGGSQDHSRIIRLMYDDPRYTALTPHTYDAWSVVEGEADLQLVVQTGGVTFAEPSHAADVARYAQAMDAAGLPYEWFAGDELRRRFPQFQVDDQVQVLFEPKAGLVDAAKANAAHVALARGYGAAVRDRCPVQAIHPGDDGVTVQTECGRFHARRLVIASGAWTNHVLASLDLHIPLTVTQEQVTYYATPYLKAFSPRRFPIFIGYTADKPVYGFPVYGEAATKAGIDLAGRPVTPATRVFDPNTVNEAKLDAWLAHYIPRFLGPKLYTKTCLYTMPPDRDFLIDRAPGHPNVLVAVGAGHAFKFASLLGQILSQLALDGASQYPIDGFGWQRPAVMEPGFESLLGIGKIED